MAPSAFTVVYARGGPSPGRNAPPGNAAIQSLMYLFANDWRLMSWNCTRCKWMGWASPVRAHGGSLGPGHGLGGPLGVIQVEEVYSASPPVPGERIA